MYHARNLDLGCRRDGCFGRPGHAFVAKVSQGGMFEVNAGKLAETKRSTQDVRDFAAAEVHDHVLVGDKLKAISSSEVVTISQAPNAEFTAKLAHL